MSAPSYERNDPKGWCGDPSRGAALGRASCHADEPATWQGQLYLGAVRLDGDYDQLGTYWGEREPGKALFWVASADYEVDFVIEARSREAARAKVLKQYPCATFNDEPELARLEALGDMLEQYIRTALWSSTDDDDEPLDRDHDRFDLAPETLDAMRADCVRFLDLAGPLVTGREGDAGHDFWLTRNGHGCGFWDGGWPEAEGKFLTKLSKCFGERFLYVGDDGLIYQG